MRKMDYFGTFLSTLNSDSPAPLRPLTKTAPAAASPPAPASSVAQPAAAADGDIESMLRLLPREPGAEASIVELSRGRGFSLNQTAAVLRTLESMGLVRNNSGRFSLTDLGREATDPAG